MFLPLFTGAATDLEGVAGISDGVAKTVVDFEVFTKETPQLRNNIVKLSAS